MSKKMTLRKIAAELEISQVTVLRALSGRPGVSAELQKKILRIASKYKYRLPNHRTGNVAVVVPDGNFSGYLCLLIRSLNQKLHKEGFCSYIVTESDITSMNDFLFDGLISTIWCAGFEKRFPQDHALPVVCVNAKDNIFDNVYKVAMDETNGIRSGLELLYRSGCKRIAFCVTPDSSAENICRTERMDAYFDFCKEHNIFDRNLLLEKQDSESIESNIEKAIEFQADAFFYANEDNVFRIYECLRKHQKRIPEDISVLGLELDANSEFMSPPLTTLRQNYERLAEDGVKMLIKLINKEEVTEEIRIPYQLIERSSIRCRKG